MNAARRLIIGCDVDAVLANLNEVWCRRYNDEHAAKHGPLTEDNWTDWDVAKCVPAEVGKAVFKYLDEPGLFADLPLIPGAVEGLKAIVEMGHDVVFISSAVAPGAATEKINWLLRHFPFIPRNNHFVTCYRKDLIRVDVLIDDGPHNLTRQRAAWGDAVKLVTIDYPYNRQAHGVCDLVAQSYRDRATAWAQIVDYIGRLP
jgi:5'-nucleotidase